jgi:hypothetical protein
MLESPLHRDGKLSSRSRRTRNTFQQRTKPRTIPVNSTRTIHRLCSLAAATCIVLLLIQCGNVGNDGGVVGGACSKNVDCASGSFCLTGGDFPGGTCTTGCGDHADCPGGSRCVDKEDGVCLLECYEPADCRGGYTCKGKKNETGGGESLVCIKD